MTITDLYGKEINVTDLPAAISQAAFMKECSHEPPLPEVDKMLQTYWRDIYEKLLVLKEQQEGEAK